MQQQQQQISTGGQSAQAAAQADAQAAMPTSFSEGNRLALKNLTQGTTEESLMKELRELSVNPSKILLVTFDKEVCAQVCFPDYQSSK